MEDFKNLISNIFSGSKRAILILLGFVVLVVIVILLILWGIFFWLSGSFSGARSGSLVNLESYAESYSPSAGGSFDGGLQKANFGVPPIGVSGDSALADRKVIRTGSLNLLVEKAEDAVDQVKSIVAGKGGFVQSANIYESDYYVQKASTKVKRAEITVRVPDKSFDQAMKEFKDLAIKVENEMVNASDVTDQVVDIEARLKNLRAEESQYQSIMAKAQKVEDILNVAGRLSDVRGRIESLQAQLENINKQVSMSTITLSLRSEADLDIISKSWRPLTVAKEAFQNLLSALTDFVDSLIKLLISLPIYLLKLVEWIIGLWIIWRIFKWIKNKLFTSQ